MTERSATILMASLQAPLVGYRRRFRLLSADTTLHADDGRIFVIPADVLLAAVPLWDGVPVKVQHARDPLKTIGRIECPAWSEETADRPAGVDGDVVLTRDTADGATAATLLEQGLIRCASSNIGFDAEEVDGRLVCSRILKVREASLVDEGDDPHSAALAAGGRKMKQWKDLQAIAAAPALDEQKWGEFTAQLAGTPLNEKTFVSALIALTGQKADVTLEDLLAAIGKILRGQDPTPEAPPKAEPPVDPGAEMAKAELARLLAAVGSTTVDAACGKVLELQLRSVDAPPVVDVIAEGIALGKIGPTEAPLFRAMLAHSRPAVMEELAKRKIGEKVPVGERQSARLASEAQLATTADAALCLSAEDKAMARQNGVSEAAMLAAKQRQAGLVI